jgi:polysaccharide pyruvyl transferase WcaK-like protein
VLGHFADANHGDDACALAVVRHCGALAPHARFVLFCRFPEIARSRFGLPAFPVRRLASGETGPWQPPATAHSDSPTTVTTGAGWRARARAIPLLRFAVNAMRDISATARAIVLEAGFLRSAFRQLRGVDLLLVTGSNPLFDYFGGYWGFPYTMWKWSVLARLAGAKFGFVSVGAGPIVSKRSGRLLASTLDGAAYVSFRDRGSERLMRSHGFRGTAHVVPDLAHSLPEAPEAPLSAMPRRVGINPMIVHHGTFWPESDAAIHDRYITSLAEFAAGLLRDGYEVFFYGTQKDDLISADEVREAMRSFAPDAALPGYVLPESIDELIELCDSADVLVTTRFHGAVFGVATARPTLAVCYHPKVREVLVEAGIGEFAFEFEEVSAHSLRSAFDDLCHRRLEIETRLADHARLTRARLHEQFDDLVGLLPDRARATAESAEPSSRLVAPAR